MKFNGSQVSQRLLIPFIACLLFSLLGGIPARAQEQASPTPEMQQMEKKMEQLENEILELKKQMSTGARPAKPAPDVTEEEVSIPELDVVSPSGQAGEPPEKSPSRTSVDFYGYVMLDAGNNFKAIDPNWFDVMRPTKLPAFAGQFGPNGNVFFGVRQTRFGVKTLTPTSLGNLKTIFEYELFGTGVDAGQTTFRLRQAYGELGHFGAGQTWSAFMDIDVFPNSLEYWGPNGMVFFRNVQFRWIPIVKGDSNVVVALERPGFSGDGGVYSQKIELQNVNPQLKWPDLTGHARLSRKWGYVQVGGIVRKIAWVDYAGNTSPYNFSGSAVGWGVNVSSNLKVTKKDVAKLSVVYGEGIENYMNDAPIDIGAQHNPSNAISPVKGVPLPVLGVVAFLDHNWSDKFSTSTGYSIVNIDNSNAQLPSDYHQGHYALTNLLYHPVKSVTMGGEFQFGRRVNFSDGFNVNDYKLQFSFRYDWSKGFSFGY
ncbi:MAG: DcaP family trimeric outer membrane transporter [Terriglobales bacterium]